MKVKTIVDVEKGFAWGILSGMTWGLDTVLMGVIMSITPLTTSGTLFILGPLIFSLFHDGFASLWMCSFLSIKKRIKNLVPILKTKNGFICILGGILGGPIALSFYMLAIKNAGSTNTVIITSSYPILGIILASIFLKERLSLTSWIGLFLCILGIIWLNYNPIGKITSPCLHIGILFAIISTLGWALESVVCAHGMKSAEIDPEIALTIRELSSFTTYICLIIPCVYKSYDEVIKITTSISILWVFLTAFIGVISYLAWYKSIDTIGVSKGISLNITYSFWAIIYNILFLGETLSIKKILCCFMIIIGVTLAAKNSSKVLVKNNLKI